MSKKNRYRGLKFNYRIDGDKTARMDKYLTIEDFLATEFPKNNNQLSPKDDTEIFNICWNGFKAHINENVKTVTDLKKALLEGCYISNTDIRLSKSVVEKSELERKSIHSIDEIRKLTKDVLFERFKQNARVELDGDIIKGNSQRYQVFFTKGIKCVCCGIEGKYFAKEKCKNDCSYHLELYAVDENGKEVLMTKDHIIPKSKGGKDVIENYQPMCVKCNVAKGNKIEE